MTTTDERQRPSRRQYAVRQGSRVGLWTVLEDTTGDKHARVPCRCDCGTERTIVMYNLVRGATYSCAGAVGHSRYTVREGQHHGQWTILTEAIGSRARIRCRCNDCGNERQHELAYFLVKTPRCQVCSPKHRNGRPRRAHGRGIEPDLEAPKFIEARIREASGHRIPFVTIHHAYLRHCEREGIQPVTAWAFFQRFTLCAPFERIEVARVPGEGRRRIVVGVVLSRAPGGDSYRRSPEEYSPNYRDGSVRSRIERALRRNCRRTDEAVAARCRCSTLYVHQVRRAMERRGAIDVYRDHEQRRASQRIRIEQALRADCRRTNRSLAEEHGWRRATVAQVRHALERDGVIPRWRANRVSKTTHAQICALHASGLSQHEVARRLGLAVMTVNRHVRGIRGGTAREADPKEAKAA